MPGPRVVSGPKQFFRFMRHALSGAAGFGRSEAIIAGHELAAGGPLIPVDQAGSTY
jgi:hypothetical protein